MSKLLVIGGAGELGRSTVLAAATEWSGGREGLWATYHSTLPDAELLNAAQWIQLDCSDHEAIRETIMKVNPTGVIYCAVPKHGGAAGKGGDKVMNGIVDDVVAAAEASVIIGARFIAISTDQVFDGKLSEGLCYKETDEINPTNPYASYKTVMEKKLLTLAGPIIICRTSLILTMEPIGKGIEFVVKCLRGEMGEIVLFTDELRNMTFSDDLGSGLVELAESTCEFRGIVHLVSDEITNRYELSKKLSKVLGIETNFVKSGLSKESGMNRPANLSLDTTLIKSVLRRTKLRGVSERFD